MKCIVVCSGKGGTGKSCVTAYMGAALAGAGSKTLLLEQGADARSLHLILGTPAAAYGVSDVMARFCEAGEAIIPVENIPGLYLMPAGETSATYDERQFSSLLRDLRDNYDFLLIDGVDLSSFPVAEADMFMLVLTPDTLCVRACAAAARKLFALGAGEVRLLINNVPPRIIPIDGVKDFDDIIDKTGAQLIGVIPASPKLSYCANNAKPLDPDSLTIKTFENLAGRLMGKRRPLLIR